ncbi:MAG: DUF2809 domain-containing protein [Candidatus Krumholzibacteriia bacterium]
MPPPDSSRAAAALTCAAAVVACLAYDRWRADLPDWWRSHGGGIPYVVFWITLWFAILPVRRWAPVICLAVTMLTCGLEFAQLWRPAALVRFRETRFGAAWLGGSFTWHDLPPYIIGGLVGYAVLLAVQRLGRRT